MSTLEITVQRQSNGAYPVVAELRRDDGLPSRNEGALELDQVELLSLLEPIAYGTLLGRGVFSGGIRDAFMRGLAAGDDRLRMLLFVEAPELQSLRWERLCFPDESGYWEPLSLNQRVPFSIYIPSETQRRFPEFGRVDLRALVLVASPPGLPRFGFEPFNTRNALQTVLTGLAEIPSDVLAEVEDASGPPTLDHLCQALTENHYPLLHIVAHGLFQKKTGETAVLLAGKDGQASPVDAATLIERLKRITGIRGLPHFTFLATCESADPRAEGALGGLAHRMVRDLGMPAVLAMTEKVSQETALALGQAFYPRLLQHGAVDRALVEAMAGLHDRPDATVPALYSRLGDRPLFSDDLTRPSTPLELAQALERMEALFVTRAPVLLPRLKALAGTLRPTLEIEDEALSKEARREREDARDALDDLCEEVLEMSLQRFALGAQPPAYDETCPFPGLSAFTLNDCRFFFGRDALVERLGEALQQHPFLAVLGPSGSGKSSLVMAGLPTYLEAENGKVRILRLVPGASPLRNVQRALSQGSLGGLLNGRKRQTWLAVGGRGATRSNTSGRSPPGTARAGFETGSSPGPNSQRTLLIVDQFEEVFTLCASRAEREAFFQLLLDLASDVWVVVTMRADFWGGVAPFPDLRAAMEQHQVLAPPMTPQELRGAIEQQAAAVRLRFDNDLAAGILDDVSSEPGAMPLLQHALLELWKRRHGRWLRADEYRALGGVARAISSTAESIYLELPEADRDRVRHLFTRLTRVDDDSSTNGSRRDTRRRVDFSELIPAGQEPALTRALIRRLADSRLVVTNRTSSTGEETVEVTHEALIRHWPRLRRWLDDDRQNLRQVAAIAEAAKSWEAEAQDEACLIHRGGRLEEAEALCINPRYPFSELETAYVNACVEVREREAREKETQRQRELEHARELARNAQVLAEEQEKAATAEATRAQDAEEAAVAIRKRSRMIAIAGSVALLAAIMASYLYRVAETRREEADRATELAEKEAARALEQSRRVRDGLLVSAADNLRFGVEKMALLREVLNPDRAQGWLQGALDALALPWYRGYLPPDAAASEAGLAGGPWEYCLYGGRDTFVLKQSGVNDSAMLFAWGHQVPLPGCTAVDIAADGSFLVYVDEHGALFRVSATGTQSLGREDDARQIVLDQSDARVVTSDADGSHRAIWPLAGGPSIPVPDGRVRGGPNVLNHQWLVGRAGFFPFLAEPMDVAASPPRVVAPCGRTMPEFVHVTTDGRWAWVNDGPSLRLCPLEPGMEEPPIHGLLNVLEPLHSASYAVNLPNGSLAVADYWGMVVLQRTSLPNEDPWFETHFVKLSAGHPGSGSWESPHIVSGLQALPGGGVLVVHRCGGISLWTPTSGLTFANLPTTSVPTTWAGNDQTGRFLYPPPPRVEPAHGRFPWNGALWELEGGDLHQELSLRSEGPGPAVVLDGDRPALARVNIDDPTQIEVGPLRGAGSSRLLKAPFPVTELISSPNGTRLLMLDGDPETGERHGVVLDVSTANEITSVTGRGQAVFFNDGVTFKELLEGLELSPDRRKGVPPPRRGPRADVPFTELDLKGEEVETCVLRGHTAAFDYPVWSSDSALIASVGERILIHRATCDPQTALSIPTTARPIGFIPGTHDLVSLAEGGVVRVWPLDATYLRDTFWQLTDHCLPLARRQTLLSEDPEAAQRGYAECLAAVSAGQPPARVKRPSTIADAPESEMTTHESGS